MNDNNAISIDVEEWFHILDSPLVPAQAEWATLEHRIEHSLESLLQLLWHNKLHATFFWLGWAAERHSALVRKCHEAGHEIASHGFGHVLAYQVGKDKFREDITKAKNALEDITGSPVKGFRAPGFGIRDDTSWAFDIIKEAGYEYDSSVFPSSRSHGGMRRAPLEPYVIQTNSGPLVELSMSMVEFFGLRFSLFGGGYLRLAPKWLIKWGIDQLSKAKRPLIIYVHPREVDPHHPRIPLPPLRRFKCYVNLHTTMPKLEWLCKTNNFMTMAELAETIKPTR